ncbi:MotA/TolQ/ExbB proton channel family protein [Calditrichota bacterium]
MNWSKFFHQFNPEMPGYAFFWLILVFLVIAIAIMIERFYYIWIRSNVNAERFMGEIRKLVTAGDFKKAIALCKAAGQKSLPLVVHKALIIADQSEIIDFRAVQNAVDEAFLEIVPRMQKRTGWLATFANVGTLTGLLGTIFGLIQSFEAMGAAGGGAEALSQGIAVAMMTTLWGLVVAIPALLAHTWITTKTQAIIDDIDEHSVKLIHLLTGAR